jgi:uncharacterized membrane protein AbrB (regulator of aidB expression)
MLVSSTLHLSGATDGRIPFEIVAFAPGALGVTIAFAFALPAATGLDALLLVLGYAPGGLAETGLVARSMGFDSAILARVMMVGFGVGAELRLRQ